LERALIDNNHLAAELQQMQQRASDLQITVLALERELRLKRSQNGARSFV